MTLNELVRQIKKDLRKTNNRNFNKKAPEQLNIALDDWGHRELAEALAKEIAQRLLKKRLG